MYAHGPQSLLLEHHGDADSRAHPVFGEKLRRGEAFFGVEVQDDDRFPLPDRKSRLGMGAAFLDMGSDEPFPPADPGQKMQKRIRVSGNENLAEVDIESPGGFPGGEVRDLLDGGSGHGQMGNLAKDFLVSSDDEGLPGERVDGGPVLDMEEPVASSVRLGRHREDGTVQDVRVPPGIDGRVARVAFPVPPGRRHK
ncbi:hypothetical protein ABH19_09635 [Leptospirillum sp. Group II 'CF-1']|nr:hypothetical protein ABH19_09635 [Leptospirillum sp. Group II 'CF-1']